MNLRPLNLRTHLAVTSLQGQCKGETVPPLTKGQDNDWFWNSCHYIQYTNWHQTSSNENPWLVQCQLHLMRWTLLSASWKELGLVAKKLHFRYWRLRLSHPGCGTNNHTEWHMQRNWWIQLQNKTKLAGAQSFKLKGWSVPSFGSAWQWQSTERQRFFTLNLVLLLHRAIEVEL